MPNANATIDLIVKDKRFAAAMTKAQAVLKRVGAHMEAVAAKAKLMLLGAGAAMAGFVKAASDYEETAAKFKTVFRDQADAAEEWAVKTARAMNRSKVSMMEYMARLQDTFVPFGIARNEAAELAKQVTTLGIDLASFHNQVDADVIRDLTSALVGNHETVRKYGVVIMQNVLNQKLLSMGFKAANKGATEQQKVLARLALIMDGTADAQGDAIRTSDSFANQLKGLKADALDLATALGNALLPMAKKLVERLRELAGPIARWAELNREMVVTISKWTVATLGILAILPRLIALLGALWKAAAAARGVLMAMGGVTMVAAFWSLAAAIGAAVAVIAKAHLELKRTLKSSEAFARLWDKMRAAESHEEQAKAYRALAELARQEKARLDKLAELPWYMGGSQRAREAAEDNAWQQEMLARKYDELADAAERAAEAQRKSAAAGVGPGEPAPTPAAPGIDLAATTEYTRLMALRERLLAERTRFMAGSPAEPVFSMAGRFESAEGVHRRISEAAGANLERERERRKLEAAEATAKGIEKVDNELRGVNAKLEAMQNDPDGALARFS